MIGYIYYINNMVKNENTKRISSNERFNTKFWEEQKRKTLIESTGASMRLSGVKITNEEVKKIIGVRGKKKHENRIQTTNP